MLALFCLAASVLGYGLILFFKWAVSTETAKDARSARRIRGVPELLDRGLERIVLGTLWAASIVLFMIAIIEFTVLIV